MESSEDLQTCAQVLKKYPIEALTLRGWMEREARIVFLGRVTKDGGECCGLSVKGCFRAVNDTLGTNSQMCLSDRAPEGQGVCLTSFSCYKQKPSQPHLSFQRWRLYRKDAGWCREDEGSKTVILRACRKHGAPAAWDVRLLGGHMSLPSLLWLPAAICRPDLSSLEWKPVALVPYKNVWVPSIKNKWNPYCVF